MRVRDRYHDPALNKTDWVAIRSRYRPLALAATTDEAFWELLDKMTRQIEKYAPRDADTKTWRYR